MTLVTILSREDRQTTNGKTFVRVKMQMPDGKTAWASCWKPEVSPRIVAGEHLDVELETREDGGRQFTDIVSAAPPSLPLPGLETPQDAPATHQSAAGATTAQDPVTTRIYRCEALKSAVVLFNGEGVGWDVDVLVGHAAGVLAVADVFYTWLQGGQSED